MPKGAKVLTVAYQHNALCLWAEVSADAPKEQRLFLICGTGHPIPDGAQYIGTVQDAGGSLIWHVYEITPRQDAVVRVIGLHSGELPR
jgi:hypothetical protein